jgi:hypothetical protein
MALTPKLLLFLTLLSLAFSQSSISQYTEYGISNATVSVTEAKSFLGYGSSFVDSTSSWTHDSQFSDNVSDQPISNEISSFDKELSQIPTSGSAGTEAETAVEYHPELIDTELISMQCDNFVADGPTATTFIGGFFKAVTGEVQKVKAAYTDGKELINATRIAIQAWRNVTWSDGTTIKTALIDSVLALRDAWETIKATFEIAPEGGDLLEAFLEANPEIKFVINGVEIVAYAAENGKNCATDVMNLVDGLEHGHWIEAFEALGALMHEFMDLKDNLA